ncbi:hypothetical protein BA059_11035 [Mycolicibacterium sp. (ex Dasyatis americana)]|uniref:Uncharacterized protein n=1 Tax=Mycobacterium syngnathidarum TaxID=1908205 RepID=A0A1S1KKB8_9MYCO|nr:hypothetical protein BA059_11035 [Mycolicibacterium sp. (ex Dasyatis americana)]OHU07259.1 hypothetical protein BKG61_03945 [Mycobacterium syngnathidarum]OLT98632.1 hypothetical protein BKG60_01140 [Mycobacterium syngnathidarum]
MISTAPQLPALPQPFAENSPFRTPIPADAEVDPNSAAMIGAVGWDNSAYVSTIEFGLPIYTADADTPRHSVSCVITTWGRCPFRGQQVPIPDDARPQYGSDAAMVVIDPENRKIYEFWGAKHDYGSWTTQWAAVNDLDGSGWGGSSTGSGASRLAGVVRVAEIAQGSIPHALAMESNNVCANVFRPPALKTDGRSTRPDCIPEGARIQLDPSLDIDSLGLAPAERYLAEALQRFGGYITDVSGSPLSISVERDNTAPPGTVGQTYSDAGVRWDYDGMTDIPWKKLRVLK